MCVHTLTYGWVYTHPHPMGYPLTAGRYQPYGWQALWCMRRPCMLHCTGMLCGCVCMCTQMGVVPYGGVYHYIQWCASCSTVPHVYQCVYTPRYMYYSTTTQCTVYHMHPSIGTVLQWVYQGICTTQYRGRYSTQYTSGCVCIQYYVVCSTTVQYYSGMLQ